MNKRSNHLVRKTGDLTPGAFKIFVFDDGTYVTGRDAQIPEGAEYALEAPEGFGVDFNYATYSGLDGTWLLYYVAETEEVQAKYWIYPSGPRNDGTRSVGFRMVQDTTPQVGSIDPYSIWNPQLGSLAIVGSVYRLSEDRRLVIGVVTEGAM